MSTGDQTAALRRLMEIYEGSDGKATTMLYEQLGKLGPVGVVALNIFRAQKNSARAKVYRGGVPGQGSYRGMAYDRKQWAMRNLCSVLTEHAGALGITWGWGIDARQEKHSDVLYIELPTGQVSFHTEGRGEGPKFPGKWDGVRGASTGRILQWIAGLMAQRAAA